jgi:hypothetical protein
MQRGIEMRLYYDQKGNWAGTQADAKKAFGKDWWEIDVPTSKAELLDFLNLHNCLTDLNTVQFPPDEPQPFGDKIRTMMEDKSHPQSCSANTEYRDPSAYDVRDVVLNCDRKHLGSALGAIISRLHDELGDV